MIRTLNGPGLGSAFIVLGDYGPSDGQRSTREAK